MSEPKEDHILYAGRHLVMVTRGRWEFVTRTVKRPAVAIIAVTDDERVVLVEQYRPPVGENVIELPAGLTGDVAGAEDESLLDSAKRELLEETGYEAARWTELSRGYSSPGLTDELDCAVPGRRAAKNGPGRRRRQRIDHRTRDSIRSRFAVVDGAACEGRFQTHGRPLCRAGTALWNEAHSASRASARNDFFLALSATFASYFAGFGVALAATRPETIASPSSPRSSRTVAWPGVSIRIVRSRRSPGWISMSA